MFNKTLSTIEATDEQLEIIKEFNPKYQFRFVVLHERKLEEYREKHELARLRNTRHFDETSIKSVE